jgi:DNA-binding NarL/FixJ family response regulator
MVRTCCFAGLQDSKVSTFSAVLRMVGTPGLATVSQLDVAELGRLRPDVLVCDVDALDIDPLEFLRRIRFVLPRCIIAVYTDKTTSAWSLACHLAGANCLLSKSSDEHRLARGLRVALNSGCYTDPSFAA